ncbi:MULTISPECIES: DNA-methyltransferase [unclassified Lebetimonas]|uniref:DNA-methyltransferase n=1 Tax=unclassified Lebetimonas TaxID=2648158 RepID=UPI000466BEEB|nr:MULTISPECIES: site-specific DNA-methyltransferase [unclassified Lebetimonas]
MSFSYKTIKGKMFCEDFFSLYDNFLKQNYKNKFQLIITSPPFPLNNKKKYGNLKGEKYLNWFESLAPIFEDLLKEDGSLVIEIGNSWEEKRPVHSLLPFEALLRLVKNEKANLRLIQEFIVYNPSRLPSPAQWVTVNRIRTIDSYTRIWWIAKSDFPKADNRKVLRPYSKSMKNLLKRKNYNSGKRPSEHNISEKSFLKNNGGSISHNLFELEPLDENREVRLPYNVLSFSNTSSNDSFLKKCRELGITPHPARMHPGIVSFFVEFLTDEEDLILDPFAGSNTTGFVAEKLNRRWISCELKKEYVEQSKLRFENIIKE